VDDPAEKFRKIAVSLSTYHGCLLYGLRAVIPAKLRSSILSLLHQGHFGVQHMNQLARTAVYWPNIDQDIADLCRKCTTCYSSKCSAESSTSSVDATREAPESSSSGSCHQFHGPQLVGDG